MLTDYSATNTTTVSSTITSTATTTSSSVNVLQTPGIGEVYIRDRSRELGEGVKTAVLI